MSSPTFGILAVALMLAGFFSFMSIFVWAHQRRWEREAYYRSEALRRLSETGGAARELLIQVLQENEGYTVRRRLEACKLAGVITLAAGVAIMIFIKAVDTRSVEPSYLVGLIPVSVGLGLLLYAYVLAPRGLPGVPANKT